MRDKLATLFAKAVSTIVFGYLFIVGAYWILFIFKTATYSIVKFIAGLFQ